MPPRRTQSTTGHSDRPGRQMQGGPGCPTNTPSNDIALRQLARLLARQAAAESSTPPDVTTSNDLHGDDDGPD